MDLGTQILLEPAWDWGRHVFAGMLFQVDGRYVRVHGRSGVRLNQGPSDPCPHDVRTICRALGAGSDVRVCVEDPATMGCLSVLSGEPAVVGPSLLALLSAK